MTLIEYMRHLTEIVTEHPEWKELKVVSASNKVGDNLIYTEVKYIPWAGVYSTGDFISAGKDGKVISISTNEEDERLFSSVEPNAICIN